MSNYCYLQAVLPVRHGDVIDLVFLADEAVSAVYSLDVLA